MKLKYFSKKIVLFLTLSLIVFPSLNKVFALTKTIYPSADTYVSSTSNTLIYGTASQMAVSSSNHSPFERRIVYMKFDLSSIPPYATIDSATLNVYAISCAAIVMPNKMYVGLVTGNWKESDLVWSNKPSYTANFSNVNISSSTGGYRQWSVKQMVALWVTGVKTNYGLSMDFNAETDASCYFIARENPNSKPYLSVNYTIPTFSITNPSVSAISARTAKFTWNTTGLKSDTYVYYGLPGSLTQLKGLNDSVEQHTYTLTGLNPATRYEYRLMSKDKFTNLKSQAFFFTTSSATTPTPVTLVNEHFTISNIKVTEVTSTSARVSWETSKEANTILSFGKVGGEIEGGTLESAYITNHSVVLNDLDANSEYKVNLDGEAEDDSTSGGYSDTFRTRSEDQVADTTSEQPADQNSTDNSTTLTGQNLETEPGPYSEETTNTSPATLERGVLLPNTEPKLTGFQQFASAAFSSSFVMALLSPGTFMLFPIFILVIFIIIVVKIFKKIFKKKETTQPTTPVAAPIATPEPIQENKSTITNRPTEQK
jgi:hypothetical protein